MKINSKILLRENLVLILRLVNTQIPKITIKSHSIINVPILADPKNNEANDIPVLPNIVFEFPKIFNFLS